MYRLAYYLPSVCNMLLQVWDLASGQCIQTLEAHSDIVTSLLCWKEFLLSCSLDGTIKVCKNAIRFIFLYLAERLLVIVAWCAMVTGLGCFYDWFWSWSDLQSCCRPSMIVVPDFWLNIVYFSSVLHGIQACNFFNKHLCSRRTDCQKPLKHPLHSCVCWWNSQLCMLIKL